jgi:sugar phosphate isomerase/epimerase
MLRVAREAGFDAVDIDLTRLRPADDLIELRERLDTMALRPGVSPLPVEMREDAHTFADGLARFDAHLEAAAVLGLRVLHRSLPASHTRRADDLVPVLRRRWSALADRARERGIRLAVEPLGTRYRRTAGPEEIIWRTADAVAFAASCGEGVGVLVDSWHWHLAGETADDIAAAGSAIVHVHVADVPARAAEDQRDDERVLPGEGTVDFRSFTDGLRRAGYFGLVSPEVPGAWLATDPPAEVAERTLAATRAAFEAK